MPRGLSRCGIIVLRSCQETETTSVTNGWNIATSGQIIAPTLFVYGKPREAHIITPFLN